MEQRLLNANERSAYGKSAAVKIRKEGRIPAVMYDRHGKSVSLDVDKREFMKLFKLVTESTIVTLSVTGKDYEVFIKDFQHDIVNDEIKHIDFYEVERGKTLRTKVKIRLDGSPEGVRHGGILETGITELELECLPKDLPPRIIVDVSALDVNQSLHVRDIKLPEAVTVLTNDDITVAAIKFAAAETTTPAETEVEEAEAPAAEPDSAEAK
ncbi:50S ribosomal protein L25 [Treponema putidum]|uniref:Large ribosomal subunit protein bL25 n=1 Tax=Treponema putidum TaxID=221027 RepID=A0ABY5HXM1_9SPIR|nr:50S ribosomal protein L25 [Treponema putidum]AIN94860.1 50S ribosomal protein L25 [Treponema putidum]TWI77148.1 large subunit ribosomal protein L25 [Treponema putidum]UTY28877.1 50S ribosomal protein L25 [Treponema putidum]UTY31295.1 50S ribosomal protein L25 [Treponema putidum]